MTYKTIVVLLNDTGRAKQLLDAASSIARTYDAHVIGLYVVPAAKIYADGGLAVGPVVFEGYRDLFKSKLEGAREGFERRATLDGFKAEWRAIESDFPDIAGSAILHARAADLVIASQAAKGEDESIEADLADRLAMESGRPVLIIPQTGKFAPRGEGFAERAVIGVNGTRESARAMFDALPLLKMVKEARLVWVDPYKSGEAAGPVPGAAEAEALARHGIKAVAEPMMTDGRGAGEALLARANDLGADLLVMGAYGHSRMREFVFGGATRHVLDNLKIPALVSH